LLNARNGTIDLRTGELRPHRREDMITKCTAAIFDPTARSELFERVLNEAFANAELAAFFQCALGYSCTGDTGEERIFMPIGKAASAKSTLLEAVRETLGDYSIVADFDAFVAKKNPGGP